MTKPELPRSPLVLVVVQIQFSPVEGIREKYIPEIQEELRKNGFPYCENAPLQQLTMTGNGWLTTSVEQWYFTDKTKQTNIVLSKNSLVVNTVKYTTFGDYLPKVGNAIEIISRILKLSEFGALEQVGLRYVDWIYSLDGISSEKMINEQYLGGFLESDKVVQRQIILERKTDVGGVIRTILAHPDSLQSVLGEFQTIRLDLSKFLRESDNDCLILDMLHVKKVQGEDFSREHILEIMESLHDELDDLFFVKFPTQEAMKAWNQKGETQ